MGNRMQRRGDRSKAPALFPAPADHRTFQCMSRKVYGGFATTICKNKELTRVT
tara:strand:- start:2636 stop:2794 length:159 start_codon:yes stop_codon:yes gene_type:complete